MIGLHVFPQQNAPWILKIPTDLGVCVSDSSSMLWSEPPFLLHPLLSIHSKPDHPGNMASPDLPCQCPLLLLPPLCTFLSRLWLYLISEPGTLYLEPLSHPHHLTSASLSFRSLVKPLLLLSCAPSYRHISHPCYFLFLCLALTMSTTRSETPSVSPATSSVPGI